MSWWSDARRVAHWELELLRRFSLLRWAVLCALVVPALYALIYLSSVWDPAAHTRALPVGLVNLDRGATYRDRDINLGAQVLAALERGAEFDYRLYDDTEAARRDVRLGTLDFMVQIPADFSSRAVPGEDPGAAKLVIYTSEGNNYTGAGFAKRFAPEVVALINAMLNEARWSLVLETTAGSQRSLDTLRTAIDELATGAESVQAGTGKAREAAQQLARATTEAEAATGRLHAGAQALSEGGAQVAGGLRQLTGTLRAIESRRPPDAELAALRSGTRGLIEGHRDLGRGLEVAQAGALRLDDGLAQLHENVQDLPLVGGRLAEAAVQLREGAGQLASGLGALREGQARLAAGSQRVDESVFLLTDGVQRSGSAIAGLVGRLPEEARLDAFGAGLREVAVGAGSLETGARPLAAGAAALQAGLAQLQDGSARVATGLDLVRQSLPGVPDAPGGTARGLAASVEPAVEIDAPVANNGTALTPNFVPLALWIGASMTAFLFHFRRIPRPAADTRRSAQVAAKLALPTLVVLLQAAVMMGMLALVLDVRVPNPLTFGLILTTASFTFLAIVFALVRLFGEIGKAAAIVLLTVQLASAGALLPIQLSGPFFQALHPLLPFTWVVKAFRASLFGAYEGAWVLPWAVVLAVGAAAVALAVVLGRSRVVEPEAWRPTLDMD